MRLTKIKLAGFKSFVDPTTVVLPSTLVGVVGPNGCGKSNIIDCVRWVMGESSAKHLRGESMVDVIFNGSVSRNPVSQATVELVFDNREGRLGGQYASYSEISVKRMVNRDAQSAYYLNGTRCRRRDITEVFLGTGLGPRSYAIIEQGMISRVVEAKPDELRTYLEEAAGISLYKERRKETERRIQGTRDNLSRLNDVREEVGQQLDKLKRQAEAAERYKQLKAEERARRGELIALRMRGLDSDLAGLEQQLQAGLTEVEAAIAGQRQIERDIERCRELYTESTDALSEVQGRYYAIGSDIARIEQQIAHQRELRDKQQKDHARNQETLRELETGIAQDEEKLEALRLRLDEIRPELEAAREGEEEANERLAVAQEALDDWQSRWEQFNQDAAEPVRIAQVERTRIEQMERRSQELERRRQRLGEERDGVRLDALEAEFAALGEQEATSRGAVAALGEQIEGLQDRLGDLRAQADGLRGETDNGRGELQREQARLGSLETLQQAALGGDGPLAEWLSERGWQQQPRLAQLLQVEAGWERAVETVLGQALQAIAIDDMAIADMAVDDTGLDPMAAAEAQLAGLAAGDLTIFPVSAVSAPGAGEQLLAKVKGPGPLADLLAGVYCAADPAAARARRERLSPGESVVTASGLWLGRQWARVHAGEGDAQGGVLAREREIAALRERIERLSGRLRELTDALEEGQQALDECEQQLDARQLARNENSRSLATLQAQLEARRARLGEHARRQAQLSTEIEEISGEIARGETETRDARGRLQAALERGEALDAKRESLQRERGERSGAVDEYRHQLRQHRDLGHELSLKIESASSAQRSIQDALSRLRVQHDRALERGRELESALAALSDPAESLGREREALLSQRVDVEAQLAAARALLADSEQRMRELEQARTKADAQVQALREGLESGRLKAQTLTVRRQGEDERLAELGLDYPSLLIDLAPEADEKEWQEQLARLEARVARLGPINLAAIEEYEALKERAGYLEHQQADLMEALETLEEAIRKIDRETRQRFKDTYDKVNAGVQRIFPRLFGGGQGYLELTGDDLLETGVTIMARPPGKRITNIHLLSGGEKALTAVALVFAIFALNPAPFCMLDEVDAPLDEANVGRFCEMLVEMSSQVQFIFITHNKVTMQIAEHLQGVTMHEPGVSRLVSVDVDEAVRLAAV